MITEDTYRKLPIMLQNLSCSIIGWKLKKYRMGGDFTNLLTEAKSRFSLCSNEMFAYRDQKLASFIEHAYNTVPYYKNLFDQIGLSCKDVTQLSDLNKLPIITKDIVQSNYENLISNAVKKSDRSIAHTSGTTGSGFRFETTRHSLQEQWVTFWRHRQQLNIPMNTWCGYFGGRAIVNESQIKPPYWRTNYPGKQILFSAYHVSNETAQHYLNELENKQPPWIHGYPSILSTIGSYMIENKVELNYKLKWLTYGSENLLFSQKEIIEKAFNTRIIGNYGMTEGVANASECPKGVFHVDEDFAAVEFVPIDTGDNYKVVGTNFTNLAMPLIRYDTNDIVTLSADGECPCGNPGRSINKIDGRQEDFIVMENGTTLGRLDHIFKDMVNIREAQIHQSRDKTITFKIVKNPNFNSHDENMLRREITIRMGIIPNLNLEYVDNIQRSTNGKLRFVVSELNTPKPVTTE